MNTIRGPFSFLSRNLGVAASFCAGVQSKQLAGRRRSPAAVTSTTLHGPLGLCRACRREADASPATPAPFCACPSAMGRQPALGTGRAPGSKPSIGQQAVSKWRPRCRKALRVGSSPACSLSLHFSPRAASGRARPDSAFPLQSSPHLRRVSNRSKTDGSFLLALLQLQAITQSMQKQQK